MNISRSTQTQIRWYEKIRSLSSSGQGNRYISSRTRLINHLIDDFVNFSCGERRSQHLNYDFISHIRVKQAELIGIEIGVRGNYKEVCLLVSEWIGNVKRHFFIHDLKIRQYQKDCKRSRSGNARAADYCWCAKVEEVDIDKLTKYDLLAVGGLTHMRTASKPMKHFWNNSARLVSGARRRWFDTKTEFRLAEGAGEAIENKLRKIYTDVVKSPANPDRWTVHICG